MNILQVTPRYPPHDGGVETHVHELATRLVDRGHRVTVHTADAGADVPRRETCDGVRVVRHRAVAPSGAVHFAPGIATAVRDADVDIVHAHNYHSLPLGFAALAAGDTRLVATPHYHGASASKLRDRLLLLYRPFGARALRTADAVVAVSDWERQQLQRDFGVSPKVVPNGVDVQRFSSATPEQRDRPYLLTVGRLEAYKGVQYAIRALSHLSGYELVVAGSGPYRSQLEQLAVELGVETQVEFLGYVSSDRLPALYAGATVHLVLSSFEAYGMTVAEALAAGTPCVVRKKSALNEWADREDCLGIESVTPESINTAVEAAAQRLAPSSPLPDWGSVVDKVLSIYRKDTP